jgi:catechol 2,3-dioxygenase-like lactoylglutathione lyase family enzyme
MFYYITLGTNDLKRTAKFYDAVMKPLGIARSMMDDGEVGYAASGSDRTLLYITRPYDKSRPASHGNGTMLAFPAPSRAAVDAFHAAAVANGGTDDGKPGLRPYAPDWYAAYVRDPDGNKLSAVHREKP